MNIAVRRSLRWVGGLLVALLLVAGVEPAAAATDAPIITAQSVAPADPPLPEYPGLAPRRDMSTLAVSTTPTPCDNNGADKVMTRSQALTRANSWLSVGIPYSQERCYRNQYGDYRTDCSGFVSMAWGLGGSGSAFWTGNLLDRSYKIARSDLEPADALLRHTGDTSENHVALFVRWADSAHTQPVVIEQTGSSDTVQRTWSASYAALYTPVRYDNIINENPVIAVDGGGTQMIVDLQGRVHAKLGVGLYGWTLESDPWIKAVAANGGTQMILDSAGKVWAKKGIGLYGWTLESDGGNVAIAVGSDGTQMILDSAGKVWAKNGIGLYGWTLESDAGVKAIATNGGVQMIIGSDGYVWAKNSIGLYGWTRESDAAKAIAVSSGGTQMILDPQGQVWAKNGIGLYGWTRESDAGTTAIAIGSDGTQMILDSQGRVQAKNGVGLYGWTLESDGGVKAIATNGGVQMIIGSDGKVWAKSSIGLYGWTRESDPIA